MRAAVTGSAAILATPGAPLSAAYWTGRRDGESPEGWARRTSAEQQMRLAQRHLDRAQAAMARARDLMAPEDGRTA